MRAFAECWWGERGQVPTFEVPMAPSPGRAGAPWRPAKAGPPQREARRSFKACVAPTSTSTPRRRCSCRALPCRATGVKVGCVQEVHSCW
jgi:hypothetical protein